MKNKYLISAGIICLLTSFIHLIGGQLDLVTDMSTSNMDKQAKAEWLGVWHMVTFTLFAFSFYLIKAGTIMQHEINKGLLKFIGVLSILYGLAFIFASLYSQIFAPQWILIIPIGVLVLLGIRSPK